MFSDAGAGELVSKGDTVTYQTVQEDENIVLDDLKNYEKSMAQAFLLTKGCSAVWMSRSTVIRSTQVM